MGKKRVANGKERYRKKPLALSRNKSPIDEDCEALRAYYKPWTEWTEFERQMALLLDRGSFTRAELKAIYEEGDSNVNEFARCMVELADKGVNIVKISDAMKGIPERWGKKTGTSLMDLDLSKITLRDEKAIRNAFKLLRERIKPVFPDYLIGQKVNREIAKMQAMLSQYEKVLGRYFYLRIIEACFDVLEQGVGVAGGDIKNIKLWGVIKNNPPEKIRAMLTKRVRPPTRSSHGLWNECIMVIVDELIRIGFSDHQSFIMTGKLLSLRYPDHYGPPDPDLVRQRYDYWKRKTQTNRLKTQDRTPKK